MTITSIRQIQIMEIKKLIFKVDLFFLLIIIL